MTVTSVEKSCLLFGLFLLVMSLLPMTRKQKISFYSFVVSLILVIPLLIKYVF